MSRSAAAARALKRRTAVRTLLVAALTAGSGCSDSGTAPGGSLLLRVVQTDGTALEDYLVVTEVSAGHIERISCPSAAPASGLLACTAEGVLLSALPQEMQVTVKKRGFEFKTQRLYRDKLGQQDGRYQETIQLAALPAFESNDDYVTGYDAKDGQNRFREMAFVVNTEVGPTHSVKFYIGDVQTTPKVYFQNTKKHMVHYDFVRDVLGKPLSLEEFEASTYRGANRAAMGGTVVYYPDADAESAALPGKLTSPISVTFFPSDDLTVEQAALAHQLLEARIGFAPLQAGELRVAYQPAGSAQEAQLQQAKDVLSSRDALWLTRDELFKDLTQQILNPGIAFGTLKYLTPDELKKTVVSYTDIVVLSRLPNELPIVGGSITEELQTPLAHVNVAARNRGTPNMALLNAAKDARVAPFLGKLVRFEVKSASFEIREATLAEAQAFWASRQKEKTSPDRDDATSGLLDFEDVKFSDSKRVGVKAANLAELLHLRKGLAAKGNAAFNSPAGFAVPFYYYNQFMATSQVTIKLCDAAKADCTDEGRSEAVCGSSHAFCQSAVARAPALWDYVDSLLADEKVKQDSALREAVLNGLVYHIKHIAVDAAFADLLDQRVTAVFGQKKVRLRSSTNAEDLPSFSGAGLYNSVTATVAEEKQLPSDEIRKVWASVWGWRAFEERSYWNIDHKAVRMGVPVHLAFGEEIANGVLITQNISDPNVVGLYVNVQKGEVSVTNPTDGALPEIFSIIPSPTQAPQVVRLRYSSLSPEAPLMTDKEIAALADSALSVMKHFGPLYNKDPSLVALDIEFKLSQPDRELFLKQVRPYVQGH